MSIDQLPDEMLTFVLDSSRKVAGGRLGHLKHLFRPAIATPHYAAVTSRGVIPHVSPDNVERHTGISAVYFGLEDFVEKSTQNAPLTDHPQQEGPLLDVWTGLPKRVFTMLGPRRVPRIQCPAQSTDTSIPICTSVGFRTLHEQDYNEAVDRIAPDALASLADIADADRISNKRIERMVDRTQSWLSNSVHSEQDSGVTRPKTLFATILPLEKEQQQLYLNDLASGYESTISGLILHDPRLAGIVPEQLSNLPRYCISDPKTPQQVLEAVSVGVDIITTPFITAVTERGIALSFIFPPPSGEKSLPLGIDMWSTEHAVSVTPLTTNCTCYTCTRHHRAYLHHLLQAKEMLAWTLLQIHNFHVLDNFFEGIRSSIKADAFEECTEAFKSAYEDDFLIGVGVERGPRMRGYQMKSAGKGEDKKREKVWGRFEDSTDVSGTQSPTVAGVENDQSRKVVEAKEDGDTMSDERANLTAGDIEKLGLAEKDSNVP